MVDNTYCCVPFCTSLKRRNPEISFHKFPSAASIITIKNKLGNWEKVKRRQVWIKNLKIGKNISCYMKVCSLHFTSNDFFKGKKI